jgi:uncharacterized protein
VTIEFNTELEFPINQVFGYHATPGALQRLIPPWEKISIHRSDDSLLPGSEVLLGMKVGPFEQRWLARHELYDPPSLFSDRQVYGPFASWYHRHEFDELQANRCRLTDRIEFEFPLGALGRLGKSFVLGKLNRTFAYRHRITKADLEFNRALVECDSTNAHSKLIAITGSRGMIGSEVVRLLRVLGHRVVRVERVTGQADTKWAHSQEKGVTTTRWNPDRGLENPKEVEGLDAWIHLAGKGIADQRWSPEVKQALWKSRVDATQVLAKQLVDLDRRPEVFVSASATGIYGSGGSDLLDESSPVGSDFLGQLATAWENAASALRGSDVRVVHGRLGAVTSPRGGALAKMLPLFRLGLGGQLGSGNQYWNWIDLEDAAAAFVWLALNPKCVGPYNLVAQSLPNRDFTREIAQCIRRPAFFPVPAWGLRLAMGEMADALLLVSGNVIGSKLLSTQFPIRCRHLSESLANSLGISPARAI